MDHINAMLQCDADDVVLREVRRNRCQALSNLIRLIGLNTHEQNKWK
jgi:hypothetical protein